jgi:hypothetical protein
LFPHGTHCLFINHREPRISQAEKKQKWTKFHWKRASTFFEDQNLEWTIFDGVDPSDVIMGGCNDCYAFAALSGIAEAVHGEEDLLEEF